MMAWAAETSAMVSSRQACADAFCALAGGAHTETMKRTASDASGRYACFIAPLCWANVTGESPVGCRPTSIANELRSPAILEPDDDVVVVRQGNRPLVRPQVGGTREGRPQAPHRQAMP